MEIMVTKCYTDGRKEYFKYIPTPPVKTIFNPPATIVYFNDGDKVISKCDKHDKFSPEIGFLMCCMKKYVGNKNCFKMLEDFVWNNKTLQEKGKDK